jgi:putative membrane protein
MPGFLTFARGSFMLDFVVVAMTIVIPILAYSIYLVKVHRKYEAHRRIQMGLGIVLGVAVTAFEIDIRLNGWEHLAEPSIHFATWVYPALYIHLFFAVGTLIGWIVTIVAAQKHFPSPVRPGSHSKFHLRWARASAFGMLMTAVTGWVFYYLAFVC